MFKIELNLISILIVVFKTTFSDLRGVYLSKIIQLLICFFITSCSAVLCLKCFSVSRKWQPVIMLPCKESFSYHFWDVVWECLRVCDSAQVIRQSLAQKRDHPSRHMAPIVLEKWEEGATPPASSGLFNQDVYRPSAQCRQDSHRPPKTIVQRSEYFPFPWVTWFSSHNFLHCPALT